MNSPLEQYLVNRGTEIKKRGDLLEITKHDDLLADVAGTWKSSRVAIKAVIQARCDVLTKKLIYDDHPYEVLVTRELIAELNGVLEDFEILHTEFEKRQKNKPEEKAK